MKVEARLRRAYAHAARSSVRRAWILAAVPIAALMVLANAYHLPLRAFLAVWPGSAGFTGAAVVGFLVAQAAVAAPVVLVAWLVAGHRARASLRSGVGSLAKARPRQGVWPWAGLAVAVATGWMATVMRVEASGAGLPYAPGALPASGAPLPAPRPMQRTEAAPPAAPIETTHSCPATTADGRRFTNWGITKLGADPKHAAANSWSWARDNSLKYISCSYGDRTAPVHVRIDNSATQCVSQGNTSVIRCK